MKGRKTQEENAFCRLCEVNLKIKFGNFQKITKYIYITRKIYLNLHLARSVEARH